MSALSEALAARDKATPWPWSNDNPWITANDGRYLVAVASEQSAQIDGGEQKDANLAVISATPEALDWIAKALPWIKWLKANIEPSDLAEAEFDALIAQAEGTAKEGEE